METWYSSKEFIHNRAAEFLLAVVQEVAAVLVVSQLCPRLVDIHELVERFNRTLKQMLSKVVSKGWPWLGSAVRITAVYIQDHIIFFNWNVHIPADVWVWARPQTARLSDTSNFQLLKLNMARNLKENYNRPDSWQNSIFNRHSEARMIEVE